MTEVGDQMIEALQDAAAFAQGQTRVSQGRPERWMSEGATESQRAQRESDRINRIDGILGEV